MFQRALLAVASCVRNVCHLTVPVILALHELTAVQLTRLQLNLRRREEITHSSVSQKSSRTLFKAFSVRVSLNSFNPNNIHARLHALYASIPGRVRVTRCIIVITRTVTMCPSDSCKSFTGTPTPFPSPLLMTFQWRIFV